MTSTDNAGPASGPAPSCSTEEWREIPGYDGWYDVSNLGRVRSWCSPGRVARRTDSPRIRAQRAVAKGYMTCQLKAGPGRKSRYVAHLVMEAFVGPRPEGMVVCHNDGNVKNNSLSNLRYATPAENEADKDLHGTRHRGEESPASKLTEVQVREIHAAKGSHRSIGAAYGIEQTTVTQIKNGETWKHLGLEPVRAGLPSRWGELQHRSRLTDEVVMALRRGEMTAREAADLCGTNIHAPWKAKVGMTWTHLPMPEKE